jgi:hypothetical protein
MAMIRQTDLPDTRKRDLLSALRRLAAMAGCAPEALRVDVPALRKVLNAARPAAYEMSVSTFSNIRSLCAAALELAGVADALPRGAAKHDTAWAPLVEAVATDKGLSTGLATFMNWCAKRQLLPTDIDDATVLVFHHWLETRTLKARPKDLVRQTVKSWNKGCSHIDGWPGRPLTPISFRPASPNLKWDELPAALRVEAEAYLALRAKPDLFAANPDAPRRQLAASTIRQNSEHIRLAASVLVRSGMSEDQLPGIAALVTVEAFKTVIRHYHEKAEGKANSFVGILAKTLIDVARYAVCAPEDQLKELKRLASKLPAIPFDLTPKNKELLQQLENPELRARLFYLPDDLIGYVKSELNRGRLRFVEAQVAIAVAILLVAPLRPQNLSELNFARHFKEPQGPKGKLVLHVSRASTKTKKRDLSFEFPPELAEPIR